MVKVVRIRMKIVDKDCCLRQKNNKYNNRDRNKSYQIRWVNN